MKVESIVYMYEPYLFVIQSFVNNLFMLIHGSQTFGLQNLFVQIHYHATLGCCLAHKLNIVNRIFESLTIFVQFLKDPGPHIV